MISPLHWVNYEAFHTVATATQSVYEKEESTKNRAPSIPNSKAMRAMCSIIIFIAIVATATALRNFSN